MLLLGDILRKHAHPRLFGRKTALIWGNEAWTYSTLNSQVNRLANGLLALGVAAVFGPQALRLGTQSGRSLWGRLPLRYAPAIPLGAMTPWPKEAINPATVRGSGERRARRAYLRKANVPLSPWKAAACAIKRRASARARKTEE